MQAVLRALVLAVALTGSVAMGQPGDEAASDEPEVSAPVVREEPEIKLKGDVVHLENGKILSGVQVLRETPSTIELQVHPDLEPLILPRRQITSIDYDKIDPNRRGMQQEEEAEEKPGVLVAQQVPETLRPLLTKPLFGATGLSLDNRDFLLPLENQGRRAGLVMEISAAVREMPEEKRLWSVELPPEAPFLSLLERLLESYPDLKVDFTEEKVIILTADEYAQKETTE